MDSVVRLVYRVYDLICLRFGLRLLRPHDRQQLVYVFDHDVVGLVGRLLRNVEVAYRDDPVLVVVLGLLSQVAHALVQSVDVVPVSDAVEGAVTQ